MIQQTLKLRSNKEMSEAVAFALPVTKIQCRGCCRISKEGVELFRCDQTHCPMHQFKFKGQLPQVETCES